MSYIGIDYGTKRVGVAVSDEGSTVAFPAEVLAEKEALAHIVRLAKEREAHTIVIGESKNYKGEDNPLMGGIRAFADALKRETGKEVVLEPEFMTSAEAFRHARGTRKGEDMIDASAAALILQSYLDKRRA